MDKTQLEKWIKDGCSINDMAKLSAKSATAVRHWLAKYGLKTRHKQIGDPDADYKAYRKTPGKKKIGQKGLPDYDWGLIQSRFDEGFTWKQITAEYGASSFMIREAQKRGLLKPQTAEQVVVARQRANVGRPHTEEAKKKISSARKDYIKKTGIAAWKTHDKFRSIPCDKLKLRLRQEKIPFEEEFMPMREQGRFFSIDIAFPQIKFGLEVNGNQHYDTNGNLTAYYQNRHDLVESAGWELVEIRYKAVFSDVYLNGLIALVRQKLSGPPSRV